MSSKPTEPPPKKSAETAFREALERLKRGRSERLPKDTPVSQNNVAKEAGVDPSALRKSRFPSLIAEIQRYVADHTTDVTTTVRQTMLAQRKRNRNLRDRVDEIKVQRDHLANLLNEANATVLELTARVAVLETKLPPSNITPMHGCKTKKES